jgi:hypothetical protein
MTKKRIMILLSIVIVLSVAGIVSANGWDIRTGFKEPQNPAEQDVVDKIESKVKSKREVITQDAIQAFDVDLDGFTYILDHKFINSDNPADKSLAVLWFKAIETSTTQKGDWKPWTYLNDAQDKGYIIKKEADGTVILFTIELQDEGYVITNKQSAETELIKPIEN